LIFSQYNTLYWEKIKKEEYAGIRNTGRRKSKIRNKGIQTG